MRIATASVPALLAVFSRTALASSCVELQGIESGGTEGVPEGVLDLDVLLKPETLGHPLAPINIFDNPLVGTVSEARLSLFKLDVRCMYWTVSIDGAQRSSRNSDLVACSPRLVASRPCMGQSSSILSFQLTNALPVL